MIDVLIFAQQERLSKSGFNSLSQQKLNILEHGFFFTWIGAKIEEEFIIERKMKWVLELIFFELEDNGDAFLRSTMKI